MEVRNVPWEPWIPGVVISKIEERLYSYSILAMLKIRFLADQRLFPGKKGALLASMAGGWRREKSVVTTTARMEA